MSFFDVGYKFPNPRFDLFARESGPVPPSCAFPLLVAHVTVIREIVSIALLWNPRLRP
jgi:hypothetical protein